MATTTTTKHARNTNAHNTSKAKAKKKGKASQKKKGGPPPGEALARSNGRGSGGVAISPTPDKNSNPPQTSKSKPTTDTPRGVRKFVMVDEALKIHITKNYEMFKRLAGNRPVRESHVAHLVKMLTERTVLIPILVNGKMEVIDGQHRLEAMKRLTIAVPYIKGGQLQLEDVQALNSSSQPWTPMDYALSYVELGNKHYKTYIDFRHKHNLGHEAACWLLQGQEVGRLRQVFQEGKFRVADLEESEMKMKTLETLKPIFPHWRDVTFIKALQVAVNRVGFNWNRFFKRALLNPDLFRFFPTIDENLLMIEEIFNRGEHKKVPIRYGQPIKKGTRTEGVAYSSKYNREHDFDRTKN